MPYWLQSTLKQGVAVRKAFDPPLPATSLARLASGHLPTPEDKVLPWEAAAKRARTPAQGYGGHRDVTPRVLRVGECTRLPDIMGWDGGPWIISQRIRDKLEELEPEAHKFIPLEVIQDDKSKHYGTYYLILLTTTLDAIIFEETRFHEGYGEEAAKASAYAFNAFYPDIHLKQEIIAGHHLWRGGGDMSFLYFCSDAFGEFVIKSSIEGWDLIKCSADHRNPI